MTSQTTATLPPEDRGAPDSLEGQGVQGSPDFRFSRMESLLRGRRLRRLTVDGVDAVFVRDPILVRQILVSESKKFGKGELFRKARNLSRVGMLSQDEAMHRHYRRLANPYLRSSAVEGYLPLMGDVVRETASSWRAGDAVDIQSEMCSIACAIAVGTLIPGMAPETTKALSERLSRLAWEMIRKPLYGKSAAARAARPGANRQLSRARQEFRELLAACVADLPDSPDPAGGYLSALLADSDEQGNRLLTAEEVCDEAVMMLTSATVTTASVMSWALHVLSRDPLAEERLLKDLTRRRSGGTDDGHGAPSYTLRFLMEVLRLYPPVWISCRKTLSDVTLGDHDLPAGTNVVFSSYLMHRDPVSYPDPHRFDPDRWLSIHPSNVEASYIPFGIGSKGCIGELFAWQELEVILDVVTQEWKLGTEPGRQVRTAPETTLHPRRLFLIPQPR
ncbi:cytochrome P450 [Streptomyces diacarni]|uniref:Cytochrome P450 n=1 Tax=Streptomyces diacarni TaxID=2800381 RepID=A0A367F5F5_9ACTN|nr:cytochrome P450 [Streptomyces diacarni]RCG24760.1 cytochrome P450 [Streptomyces diacarni]